jgi:hypothetical protein
MKNPIDDGSNLLAACRIQCSSVRNAIEDSRALIAYAKQSCTLSRARIASMRARYELRTDFGALGPAAPLEPI